MFSVYLAGPWSRRPSVSIARERLQQAGFVVNAQWLDVPDAVGGGNTVAEQEAAGFDLRAEAERDIADINMSDVMVVVNLATSEGKAVEQGMALEQGMPVIVVGPRSNVFHYLDECRVVVVDTIEQAIETLHSVQEMYEEAYAA